MLLAVVGKQDLPLLFCQNDSVSTNEENSRQVRVVGILFHECEGHVASRGEIAICLQSLVVADFLDRNSLPQSAFGKV